MITLTLSKRIDAPVERVWEVASDLEHADEFIRGITNIELLTDGPVGKGTRFRETRVMFKKEHSEQMEVSAWNPPTGYSLTSLSCGSRFDMAMTLRPEAGATTMHWNIEITPTTLFARLMSPLSRLMMGSMRKCVDEDMEDCKAMAEGRTPDASPAPA